MSMSVSMSVALFGCECLVQLTDMLKIYLQHVVFGRVVSGMEIVKAIEGLGSSRGHTKVKVTVADCGEIKVSLFF